MAHADNEPRGGDGQVLDHLLAGGELLPTQIPAQSLWSPEKRLAAAVLTSALINIRDRYGRSTRQSELDADLAWVHSDDIEKPFCFLRLCDVFGLDPGWVRQNVERWRREKPDVRVPFSMHRHAA
jgi:hypothetical protein